MKLIDKAEETEEQMQVIGITGGVGAGKSTVLNFLSGLPDVRVEEADRIGHLVMEPGTDCFRRICGHFGEKITDRDGRIDRSILAGIVFTDKRELDWLNGVIHPAVKDWFRREIFLERERGTCRLFVIEAALLIEDHYEELCDEFWYIYTEPGLRRERLKASRGYTDEKIDAVFQNQQSDRIFREHCREVIDNSKSPENTIAQIKALLARREKKDRKKKGDTDQ